MKIIPHKKIYLTISAIVFIVAILVVLITPPRVGIEFKGGTEFRVQFNNSDISREEVESFITPITPEFFIRETEHNWSIITPLLSDTSRRQLTESVAQYGTIVSFATIGPSLSAELAQKGILAILLGSFIVMIYVSYVFSGAHKRISSWKYGGVTIITLIYDAVVTLGIFTILTHTTTVTLDTFFVTAILAIIGYSINDTIVIFDRVREKMKEHHKKGNTDNDAITEEAVQASITRSINTSLTTLLALMTLSILGGTLTFFFALTMSIGVIIGTYSSLFLAPATLLLWSRNDKNVFADDDETDFEKAEREVIAKIKV